MRLSAAFTWCESTIPKQLKARGMSRVYYRKTLVALLKELHYSLRLRCWRVAGTSAHGAQRDQP
jgi:hypothetical protein